MPLTVSPLPTAELLLPAAFVHSLAAVFVCAKGLLLAVSGNTIVTTREPRDMRGTSYLALIQEVQVNHERFSNDHLWKLFFTDRQ